MQSSIPGNVGMIAQHQHGRRNRRWYLGIQSKKDPAHVMTEVYKALMALGCDWLQLSSYRIKCRWRPHASQNSERMTNSSIPQPMSGGESPDAAWNQTMQGDKDDMAIDHDGPQGALGSASAGGKECKMKIISGDDGRFVQAPNLNTPEYCIKIGLTLYKVQQNIYLLDFQKMTGDAFSFMTLCANIITELKTLSAASKKQQLLAQQQAALQAAGGIPGQH
jgi:5'-AMP-activated protein kinase catalytic alpha subunit